jgi:hypothetical protein
MLALSTIDCSLSASTSFSSSFISFNFSILLTEFASCSALNFCLSSDKLDSDSSFVFVNSIFSRSRARSFASCSERNPSTVASTAFTSFSAVNNAM